MDPLTPGSTIPGTAFTPQSTTVVVAEVETKPAPMWKERIETWQATAEEYTRREPVKAMLIALGAGLLVGKVIHLLFSTRGRKQAPVERVIIRSPREVSEWPA